MNKHTALARRWHKRFDAEEAAIAVDPMARAALAQACAMEVDGVCRRSRVTLLAEPDGRYVMAIPICGGCGAYMTKLWEFDMYSLEAAVRFDGAVARTWERAAGIGAVRVTGEIPAPDRLTGKSTSNEGEKSWQKPP